MKKIFVFIIFPIFFITSKGLLAQDKPFNLIKFGVKGYGGITDTSHLNIIAYEWLEKVVDASGAELQNEPIVLPFNIEYGYQPFFIFRPFRFLQIGVKMDFAYSTLASKFQNPLSKQNYELKMKMKSYIPGVFASLALGKLEFGGGLFRSYTNIDVNDDFFGYHDSWHGSNTGYEVSIGFSSTRENLVGFTMGIKYRDLLINDFEDSLNRKITYSNTQENMSFSMSGFIFEAGLYFQFIELKKHKNEN